MSQLFTRFADGLLAHLVPHQAAHARECPGAFRRYCYCRGDRMYTKRCEYYPAPGGYCNIVCGSCQVTRTC